MEMRVHCIAGPDLPSSVVRAGFEYAQEHGVPLCAFLGDECATLQMHPELEVHPHSRKTVLSYGIQAIRMHLDKAQRKEDLIIYQH